jgi:predicted MFS family arabinose efflux permease
MCLALAACGFQRSYILSCILLAVTGYCTITFSASTNATIQLGSDNAHRGRVMSVYSLVFGGVTPIGALYAGFFSKVAGPAVCMIVSGLLGLAATFPLALSAIRSRPAA